MPVHYYKMLYFVMHCNFICIMFLTTSLYDTFQYCVIHLSPFLADQCMASFNTSDMLSKRLLRAALKTNQVPRNERHVPWQPVVEAMGLSSYDKPAAPTLEENAFYDRYKEKLDKLKVSRPAEFVSAVESVYGDKKNASKDEKSAPSTSDIKNSSMMQKMGASSLEQPAGVDDKKKQRPGLDSIIKLDLIKDKSASDVSHLWSQYFAKKEGTIFATIPNDKYERVRTKGLECPLFIYALPHDSGFEFILGQCGGDDWYYTPLIEYQTHGEYAPYSLVVRHYTELAESKEIILMKGEIASDNLQPELATLLIHQTQMVYGSDENFTLVETMNKNPAEFKHMDVIDLYKKIGLF